MVDQLQNPYDTLAHFYDEAGFSSYAGTLSSQIITFIQQRDWIGRRILDLGCGTGMSSAYYGSLSMDVFAMDNSAAMLEWAEKRVMGMGYNIEFMHHDMRAGNYPDELDLVIALGNVMNELGSARELELVIKHAAKALNPGRFLVFDMSTLRGLIDHFANTEQVLDMSDTVFLTVQNYFNYESVSVKQLITAFTGGQDNNWQRYYATIVLRSYPISAINKMLESAGFTLEGIYDTRLREFNLDNNTDGRALFVAVRNE